MTELIKRSQIRHTAAKTQRVREQNNSGNRTIDADPLPNFARQCLWSEALQELTVTQASDVGILALTLAAHVMKKADEKHAQALREAKTEEEKLLAHVHHPLGEILHETMPLNPSHLKGALKDLIRWASVYAKLAAGNRSQNRNQGVETLFAPSAYMTDWGCDGHPWSRETSARLRLTRFFEKTSSTFARFLSSAFTQLVKNGPAYMAWSANFPVFLCDLTKPSHRHCAHLLCEQCHGECVIVTRACDAQTQKQLAKRLLVVVDREGVFEALAGKFAPAMLLERRLGGWTVTFPCGEVKRQDLESKKYPALARALAFCAQNPVYEKKKTANLRAKESLA